jgi:hypothetical protein
MIGKGLKNMESDYFIVINSLHPYLEKQKYELMPFIESFYNKQIPISAILYNNLLNSADFIIVPSIDEDLKSQIENFEKLFPYTTSIKITDSRYNTIFGFLESLIFEETTENPF